MCEAGEAYPLHPQFGLHLINIAEALSRSQDRKIRVRKRAGTSSKKRKRSAQASGACGWRASIVACAKATFFSIPKDERIAKTACNSHLVSPGKKYTLYDAFAETTMLLPMQQMVQELSLSDEETLKEVLANNSFLFHNLVVSDQSIMVTLADFHCDCWLPKRSAFACTDLLQSTCPILSHLVEKKQKFPSVVVDPPWPSASVARRKEYRTMSDGQMKRALCRLPVAALCDGPKSFVCVWTTNNPLIQDFVLDKLFSAWSLRLVGVVVWIKTLDGSPVLPFTSPERQCYELAFVGHPMAPLASTHAFPPPLLGLIVSAPLEHSRKPLLDSVLSVSAGLELFARELRSDWVSVGNEPLLFQRAENFE